MRRQLISGELKVLQDALLSLNIYVQEGAAQDAFILKNVLNNANPIPADEKVTSGKGDGNRRGVMLQLEQKNFIWLKDMVENLSRVGT